MIRIFLDVFKGNTGKFGRLREASAILTTRGSTSARSVNEGSFQTIRRFRQ